VRPATEGGAGWRGARSGVCRCSGCICTGAVPATRGTPPRCQPAVARTRLFSLPRSLLTVLCCCVQLLGETPVFARVKPGSLKVVVPAPPEAAATPDEERRAAAAEQEDAAVAAEQGEAAASAEAAGDGAAGPT
jgi:hypothetical protein